MLERVIITGGGTGGHIFPAISIANELKKQDPSVDILFIGADGGMEMSLVPKYGYKIKSVRITGIARTFSWNNVLQNIAFPFRLLGSMMKAGKLVKEFNPDVVIGVGGYASGPVGRVAGKRGIPLVICEQNAYPGITNKWLAPLASAILLGNEAAAKYFEGASTKVTGNPIRSTLLEGDRVKGLKQLNLEPGKPVVLSLGGSLGAGPVNKALELGLNKFIQNDVQLVWQCGKRYYEKLKPRVPNHPMVRLVPFIDDMGSAFAAADLVITRAGASTLSELILLNKPAILVPSPNVAEDHQTKNALSLVERNAGLMVKDVEANERLVQLAIDTVKDKEALQKLKQGIEKIEKHDAAKEIVAEIKKIVQ